MRRRKFGGTNDEDWMEELKKFKRGKSAGTDGITFELLKKIGGILLGQIRR